METIAKWIGPEWIDRGLPGLVGLTLVAVFILLLFNRSRYIYQTMAFGLVLIVVTGAYSELTMRRTLEATIDELKPFKEEAARLLREKAGAVAASNAEKERLAASLAREKDDLLKDKARDAEEIKKKDAYIRKAKACITNARDRSTMTADKMDEFRIPLHNMSHYIRGSSTHEENYRTVGAIIKELKTAHTTEASALKACLED